MSVLQTLGDAVAPAIHNVHLTHSLREAHAQAEQSQRDCVSVLAMVGHELRQPLAAIVNAMATMERKVDASVGERARAIMSRQIDHLRRLADDLLDAVQMQRGVLTLNRVPIDAVELVSDCVDAVRARVVDRHQRLTFSSSVPLWISGDPDRIRQIVSNLLDNAVKSTPTGGTIDVSTAADGEWIVVQVRDSGRGIASEQQPHIFGLFFQERSGSGRGLGIGLSVVKRLTEAHGGRFEVRSEGGVGLGSTFAVRLPAHPAAAQSIAV
jgi:signal transduction histidine kinase